MCEDFHQNYANAINTFDSVTEDLMPTLVLFKFTDCSGTAYPGTQGGYVNRTYSTSYEPITNFMPGGEPHSFFVPVGMHVTFKSNKGRERTFVGPRTVSDISQLTWDTSGAGKGGNNIMTNDTITEVRVQTENTAEYWQNEHLISMCMGSIQRIGANVLTRFIPQSSRCDTFMNNLNNSHRGMYAVNDCLQQAVDWEVRSIREGFDYPPMCFAEACARENTYKTRKIIERPCSSTICRQKVIESPGVIDKGSSSVHCNGQFFKANGDLDFGEESEANVVGTENRQGTDPGSDKSGEEPYYTWVMFGVSGFLLIFLVVMMFTSGRKMEERNGKPARRRRSPTRV